MHEWETLHRAAAGLRTALVGHPILRCDAPGVLGCAPVTGRFVERVATGPRLLELHFDDGLVLSTHVRAKSSWHLYRVGAPWRRSAEHMSAAVEVEGWVAACFDAAEVEIYRHRDARRHPGMGALAPDLATASTTELEQCARDLYYYDDPDALVAAVLLDDHVVSGLGNAARSEVLWACEMSPQACVADLSPRDCVQIVTTAARHVRAVIRAAPDVYARNGHRCTRCRDTVEVGMVGGRRPLYWCPGCQQRLKPVADATPLADVREMDPHPAAAQFLAQLPWRRGPLAG